LAGTVSGVFGAPGASGSLTTIEDLSGGYTLIADLLFNQFSYDPDNFATNVLIADQDGNVSNFVQGTGFNEDIYINSIVSIGVDGGGGFRLGALTLVR